MKKKIILVIIAFTLLFLGHRLWKFINTFGGSYHNVEFYIVNKPKEELILLTERLKKDKPIYRYMKKEIGLDSLIEDSSQYGLNNRYFTTFNIEEEQIIVKCMIIGDSISSTSMIGLGSVLRPTRNQVWARINTSDLSWSENREIKKEFEKKVLDSLGIEWRRKWW